LAEIHEVLEEEEVLEEVGTCSWPLVSTEDESYPLPE
jgi:hypothetical protein